VTATAVEPVDLGHDHRLEWRRVDGVLYGANVEHLGKDGQPCPYGWIHFDQPDGWTLEAEDPPTVSPSVLCTACGDHGFVRAGRWINA
jgi:hypothetical protein